MYLAFRESHPVVSTWFMQPSLPAGSCEIVDRARGLLPSTESPMRSSSEGTAWLLLGSGILRCGIDPSGT